ncbi:MAG: hypothetical protein QGG36_00935, partial [Pirellulaceae bacterium]|nr:hypothetical protein [Pirellulaceae bacterium]
MLDRFQRPTGGGRGEWNFWRIPTAQSQPDRALKQLVHWRTVRQHRHQTPLRDELRLGVEP